MSTSQRRCVFAGLILGLIPAGRGRAEDLPLPIPASPGLIPLERAQVVTPPTAQPSVARPLPTVVEVPPGGIPPTWAPGPIDPVALERRGPHAVPKKVRSWHWRRFQGKVGGYPEEFTPRPLGASVHEFGRTMAANGAAARLALHDYDFEAGSGRLSTRGRDQLYKLAAQLAASPYPLIIERTANDPALADARRTTVLAELAGGPFPIPADRILVGIPLPYGMSGNDAQIVGANTLTRTQQYGPPIPLNFNGLNSPSGVTNSVSGILPGQ